MNGDFIEIMTESEKHKYLGRMFNGDLVSRSTDVYAHRCQCAWMKFHQNHDALTDKNISIRLRLIFFQSVISATILFGLGQIPMPRSLLDKLDALQRRMIRRIVGWHRVDDEPWKDTMSRMKNRVSTALSYFPIESWSAQLSRRQFKLAIKLANSPNNWAYKCIKWHPPDTVIHACRSRGRPKCRWDDYLINFNVYYDGHNDWLHSIQSDVMFASYEETFVQFMSSLN